MKSVAIIPARYASTRFPGKPLVKIGEISMIERVYRQSAKAINMVVVATDDARIYDHVLAFGGQAVMTSDKHRSGTDRIAEAIEIIRQEHGQDYELIINVQGDEPFIQPTDLKALIKALQTTDNQIATLIKPIQNQETVFAVNTPKVVIDKRQGAIYFSRSPIPYLRDVPKNEWHKRHQFYRHIGIYGFRYQALKAVSRLPSSPLELAESLEQNRWLENGYSIATVTTNYESISIDTPKDLRSVLAKFI